MITYSIDQFINSIVGKDLFAVLEITEKEVRRVDADFKNLNSKQETYASISRYRDLVGDFLFFLRCGMVPTTIGKEGLRKFEPVIKSLVEQDCFKPQVLDLLK